MFVKHLDTLVGILNVWLNCKDRWLYIFGLLKYNLHWFCKVFIFALSAAHTHDHKLRKYWSLKLESIPVHMTFCVKKFADVNNIQYTVYAKVILVWNLDFSIFLVYGLGAKIPNEGLWPFPIRR